MPRYYTFENIKIACAGCESSVAAEIMEHAERLKLNKCRMSFANKCLTIEVSDESALSEAEFREEIRIILQENDRLETPPEPLRSLPPKIIQEEILEVHPAIKLPESEHKSSKYYHWQQAALGILSGTALMGMMLFNLALPWSHSITIAVASVISFGIGWPSFKEAYSALTRKKKSMNMDLLFSISSLAAISLSIAHIFFPVMPMMVDAALMIFGFRHFGQWLEKSLIQNPDSNELFVDRARRQKIIASNGQELSPKDLMIGSKLRIPRGCYIPLNGKLIDKKADLSFSLHTGQTKPFELYQGSLLCAGMVVESESLLMEVTALENDSYLQKRDTDLQFAEENKAPIQDLTQTIMNWFIPGVLLLGAGIGLSAGFLLGPMIGIKAALYLLVCACPCVLGLVTSFAVNIGLTKIKDQGLIFTTAKGLQAAAEVDTVVFDLNGTLTYNKPRVTHCTVPENYFSVIFAMESECKKCIPEAIKQHVGIAHETIALEKCDRSTHNGVTAVLDGKVYQIGNSDYINLPEESQVKISGSAQHVIYFTMDGKDIGHFILEDPLRKDAPEVIKKLINSNKKVRILTGADDNTARQYSNLLQVPFNWITTKCTPESKISEILLLKNQKRKVAMFGDSGNDSDAIAAALLGVVIKSPDTDPMCRKKADATLTNDSLLPILQIFPVGKQTMHLIRQNLWISFAYNILSLGFVTCSIFLMPTLLNPAFGAALMAVQSACVIANAYRIKMQRAEESLICCKPMPPLASSHEAPVSEEKRGGVFYNYTAGNANGAGVRAAGSAPTPRHP